MSTDDVRSTAEAIAHMLHHLDPGPLALARRMEAGVGSPVFWRLAAAHPATVGARPAPWMDIVRALAILAPKGDPAERPTRRAHPLGALLCDGGNPAWPETADPRPWLSEQRFAKLLASRGERRRAAVTRAARGLARSMAPGVAVRPTDLAWAMIGDDPRQMAEDYYRRLDRAGGTPETEGQAL